jgi:aminodeoxychorismate synthase component I
VHLYCEKLPGWSAPSDAFVTLFASETHAFWLDRESSTDDRFSVIGSGVPAGVSQLEKIADELDVPFAFRPGLVGVIDYEGGHHFITSDRAIVFDHDDRSIWFVGRFATREAFDHWHRSALLRLALVGGETGLYQMQNGAWNLGTATARDSRSDYIANIEKAQEHIAAGDVYQLCLTNRIEILGDVDPLAVFLRLRELNPTPYAAYLRLGGRAIACTSPEQFLRVSSTGRVSTKPIKGTRKRSEDAVEDAALAKELAADPKERAENLMIVDLMRNDIGKVCAPGTVEVEKLFDVETYKTVHQLVSTVTGQLLSDASALDAVLAAFPGGSMTGAPKQRAMEIITELEKSSRGFYSGVLGYLGADGSADFGMVIRAIAFDESGLSIGVGGGITSDSTPAAEFEEIRLKAGALLAAVKVGEPATW